MPEPSGTTNVPGAASHGPTGGELIRQKAFGLFPGLVLSVILLTVAAGAFVGGVRLVVSHTDTYLYPAAFIVAAFVLVSAVAIPIVMLREVRIEEDEGRKCEKDCDELDAALDEMGDPILSGLAKANFRQMRMFTAVALREARMSYYASLAAASVCLLVLATDGAVTVGLAGTGAKAAAGGVTVAGEDGGL